MVQFVRLSINILRGQKASATESNLLGVAAARIACLDFKLQKTKMQTGEKVLVIDPREPEKIPQREVDLAKEHIEKLIKAGANVVLTTEGIDDMALEYLGKAGGIDVQCVRGKDMQYVAMHPW